MGRFSKLTLGQLTAVITLGVVGAILWAQGQQMFSPGPLSARGRGQTLGGVRTHAQLGGDCSACHVPPWSGQTMNGRCLDCHADVKGQIDARGPLHGLMPQASDCRLCHTEHQGAHAHITNLAAFDHGWTHFPLTGKHREVSCTDCHVNQVFRGTPTQCASCHAEPTVHLGKFGTNCGSCHSTASWQGATFAHSFPLNHGVGKNKTSACIVCHQTPGDYLTYTCYGCHKHQPAQMIKKHAKLRLDSIDHCAHCHPTGKEAKRRADAGGIMEAECAFLADAWKLELLIPVQGHR